MMDSLINAVSKETKGNKSDLSVEELRSVPGYENISDQDAIKVLYSIKELSVLIFFASSKNNINVNNSNGFKLNKILQKSKNEAHSF